MSPGTAISVDDIPVKNAVYRMVDDLLVNPARPDEAIYISQTAALVWSLCDGRTRVSELVDLLVDAFPETGETIGHDIVEAIQSLIEQGALVVAT